MLSQRLTKNSLILPQIAFMFSTTFWNNCLHQFPNFWKYAFIVSQCLTIATMPAIKRAIPAITAIIINRIGLTEHIILNAIIIAFAIAIIAVNTFTAPTTARITPTSSAIVATTTFIGVAKLSHHFLISSK